MERSFLNRNAPRLLVTDVADLLNGEIVTLDDTPIVRVRYKELWSIWAEVC